MVIGTLVHSISRTPPFGSVFCAGQILSITENVDLFGILGNNYGGDGLTTFALPNLSAAAPTLCMVITGEKPFVNISSQVVNPYFDTELVSDPNKLNTGGYSGNAKLLETAINSKKNRLTTITNLPPGAILYNCNINDDYVSVNGTLNCSIVLTSPIGSDGREITIGRKNDSLTAVITITAFGGAFIQALTKTLGTSTTLAQGSVRGTDVTFIANGNVWYRKTNS
jgi:Phage Tail Collar Domain